jgi:hypothetical protein
MCARRHEPTKISPQRRLGGELRNIFDQYTQAENRITHSLMTALNKDRRLLRNFLRDVLKIKPLIDPKKLSVLEQESPGKSVASEEELERRGIPDGWIYDEENKWCVIFEIKVTAKLHANQLSRHRHSAERMGFENIAIVAIVPLLPRVPPKSTILLKWVSVYEWLRDNSRESPWASIVAEYLEIAESELLDKGQFVEGALTMFAGFPFTREHPYTYLEAKRILALAMDDLRKHRELKKQLGISANGVGRSAITGKQRDTIWDFLPFSSAQEADEFTKHPHLDLGIHETAIEATLTIPNRVNGQVRKKIVDLDEDGFLEKVESIVENLKPLLKKNPGAIPWFRAVQRRYPSQNAEPFNDAKLEFDMRTALPSVGPLKTQAIWLSAAYRAFVNKRGNYQMEIGARFPYESCPNLRASSAIDLVADTFLACAPLANLISHWPLLAACVLTFSHGSNF